MYALIIKEESGVSMEKEVKIALITGIVALLVGVLQLFGTDIRDAVFDNSLSSSEKGDDTPNAYPENLSLDSDKKSPQPEGIVIMWTASANDKDADRLHYKFLLHGPRTDFHVVRDWDTENTWTWTTTNEDVGENIVQVQVRDGHHEPDNSYDNKTNINYIIFSRPKAVFTYFQPTPGGIVEFDASKSRDEGGRIMSYEWNFGDGNTSSEDEGHATATNHYKNGGVHNVTLTVTNENGVKDSISLDAKITSTTSYHIRVKTKNVKNAGTDNLLVYLILHGKYDESQTDKLDNGKNNFNQNKTDEFNSGKQLDVGDIKYITLNVSAVKDHWQPEWIEITNEKTKKSWTFDNIDEVDEVKIYGPYYPR